MKTIINQSEIQTKEKQETATVILENTGEYVNVCFEGQIIVIKKLDNKVNIDFYDETETLFDEKEILLKGQNAY